MHYKRALIAAASLAALTAAGAADLGSGIEFTGYSRGGPVLKSDKNIDAKKDSVGGFSLGGDLQAYRLGNEGTQSGYEFFLGKTFDADNGVKYKFGYMPENWGGGIGTVQAYSEIWGLDFAPEAKFWVGQRRLRIQDVHIVDNFLMDLGEYQGAGVQDWKVGPASVALTLSSGDKFDAKLPQGTSASKVNLDVGLPISESGKLRLVATSVSTTGFDKNGGSGFSLLYNQGFGALKNSLYLQTSSGLANIQGKFVDLEQSDDASGVAADVIAYKVSRVADSVDWQFGNFGGQALLAYQISEPENGANKGVETKDLSFGGRVSYAFTNNFKLLLEAATTKRSRDGEDDQTLNKVTIAPTLSTGPGFYKRPELRLYVTMANWNGAAAAANADSFGTDDNNATLKKQTIVGLQYEIWW
ncbi:porin [Hylemonella gracilis str. Niagara R]|uniref:Porin n=1 Tax=Hylemonella gracilis str. Niagara R TaxID=1458275 RepID=A0A016XGE4_9BURK|nr:carbohydrate porin [Hylemonella gracilis]EYC50288.1 porin [Hylemonella gracilis str. Niagara R]